jgi:3-methyladenine DNA glycosylase AlkD
MINSHHQAILDQIKGKSGKGTSHTFLDSYLGNAHPRYAITAPVLRTLAKDWMRSHRSLTRQEFTELIDSLIKAESSTEKVFAGILMDYATPEQGAFDPKLFGNWLDHLEGWAEIDAVCTGAYTIKQIPAAWKKWSLFLKKLSVDKNIGKRRASLVFLCSPIAHSDTEDMAEVALENIERLKSEKEVLITKAISWLLRSMIRHHKKTVAKYVKQNRDTLPKIAVRETLVKLKTGVKTKPKKQVTSGSTD